MLRSTPDGVVLLDDVATIEHSSEPQWIRVTADGRDAVLFQVYQQPGANTVQIAGGIKAKLDPAPVLRRIAERSNPEPHSAAPTPTREALEGFEQSAYFGTTILPHLK